MNSDNNQKLPIFYHPSCKACNKLLSIVNGNEQFFNLIDISNLSNIPKELEKIPSIIENNKLLSGKECFEKVQDIISGPKSFDIFTCSDKLESFGGSGFNMKNNFSTLDNGIDGFKNVPKYIENNTSLEQLLASRRQTNSL